MPRQAEYRGERFSIVCAELADGSCPAGDFLDGRTDEALPESDRQKFDVLFERLGNEGRISNEEHFKKIDDSDGIWEFKRHQWRLFCFYGQDKVVYLLYGLRKKKDKHRKADIARAEGYKKDAEATLKKRQHAAKGHRG